MLFKNIEPVYSRQNRIKHFLLYIVKNCIEDFDSMKRVNLALHQGMKLDDYKADVNYLGSLHRCVCGYLIIKVATLFDKGKKNNKPISLYSYNNIQDGDVDNLKNQEIISVIIDARNKFTAHNDLKYLEKGNFGLSANKIIKSDLEIVLKSILELLQK